MLVLKKVILKVLEMVPDFEERYAKNLREFKVAVYSADLPEELQRRLARLHNTNNIGSRDSLWSAKVQSARYWLFKTSASKDGPINLNESPPIPDKSWKPILRAIYGDENDVSDLVLYCA